MPHVRNVVDKRVIIFVANSIDGLLKFLEANNIAYVITYSHTEVILSLLCAFFWVFPVRLHFIFRRFGKLCLFRGHRRGGMKNLHNYPPMKMEQTVFRNVGV